MSFQDRYYDREQSDRYNPLLWLFAGSLHVLTLAGVRIRAHASLFLFVGLALLMGGSDAFSFQHRAVSMFALVVVLILHELAHCFAARGVGGFADEVVLWPLGGLAEPQHPHRPAPTFTAVSAGLVLNLGLATLAAALLHGIYQIAVPGSLSDSFIAAGDWTQPQFWLWYLYVVSLALLILNLLPVFPLDGGHLLQTLLWPAMGYGKSLLATCNIGIGVGILAGAYGIYSGDWLIIFAMLACIAYCIQKRTAIKAAGVWTFDEYDTDVRRPRRHRLSRFTKWRARRQIRREELELTHVDVILQKIQDHGLHSLSWWERRTLRRATERHRQREMEVGS